MAKNNSSFKNLRDKFSPQFFSRGKKEVKDIKKIKKSPPKKEDLTTITWLARDFVKKERSPNWYLYAGITAIVLMIIAVVTNSPVMAVTFLLITAVVYLMADKEPNNVEIKLSPKGIYIEKKLYGYKNLKSFWIFYDPPDRKILSIIPEKVFMPEIRIQLESQNPVLVRKYLIKYIEEEEQEESLLDNLAERFKI